MSHTSQRAAKLYSGVQRVECKTRRRKGRALKEKLQQARCAASSADLDPWLTEIVPVAEVDIVEPEVLVQVERTCPESAEGQVPASILPLLQTKFPCATEQDAKLVAPLLDSVKPVIILSSEAPLKYITLPLLLGSPKVMLFVSSSITRRESFLYSVNTRKQTGGPQKSYGVHWGYGFKSLAEYIPFADISYYCSTEQIEAYRRALWKNTPRAVADMLDTKFVSAVAISCQDFLSCPFQHFLSLVKTPVHHLVLDWDSRLRDIALNRAAALCKLARQIVVIERAPPISHEVGTHLQLRQVYAKTFSEGMQVLTDSGKLAKPSSMLCIIDSANILHPNKSASVTDSGALCIHLSTLLESWTIEYLVLSAKYEPFALSQIDTLVLDCIAVPTQLVIDSMCLRSGLSTMRGLTFVAQIVSPNAVFQHIQRLLIKSLTSILYGSLIGSLLSSQVRATTDEHVVLSFQRLSFQLRFLTGLVAPPLDADLWWNAMSDVAASMGLSLHSFGHEVYTYKLLGSMKQATIERKYPVCQLIKQACELESTPERFTMRTLLCLMSTSPPDGVPLDHAGLESHLAAIHDAESQVVCCPRYTELPPCILFSRTSVENSDLTSVSNRYATKVLEDLRMGLDSLLVQLIENYSKELRDSVQSEYSDLSKHAEAVPSVKLWKEKLVSLQRATGKEYNPIAACISLLAEDSMDTYQLHTITALKLSLDHVADQCSLFAGVAKHMLKATDDFFNRLNV